MSSTGNDIALRARLDGVLKSTATGDLRASALDLLATLGYASNKTLDWPTQPKAFATEVETLLGGIQRLNTEAACLADWSSVSFLFQLTNDELPTLAAGQMSFFSNTGVQPYQIESFIFLAVDLKPGNWSRTRLARITRELNRLFPMPVIVLYRHPGHDQEMMLSLAVINRRAHKRDSSRDVMDGKISIIKDIDLRNPHAAHLRILESMALSLVSTKYVPSSFAQLYEAWMETSLDYAIFRITVTRVVWRFGREGYSCPQEVEEEPEDTRPHGKYRAGCQPVPSHAGRREVEAGECAQQAAR